MINAQTLADAAKDYIALSQRSIDSLTESDCKLIGGVCGDFRKWTEIKDDLIRLRKRGKIGPVLGGSGPQKIADVICPHCGERHGGDE